MMGIENMPIQCMACPRVLESKIIAESIQERADAVMSDFSFLDLGDDDFIALIMESRMSVLLTNETMQQSYQVQSEFWERQARLKGCEGFNAILMDCGLALKH